MVLGRCTFPLRRSVDCRASSRAVTASCARAGSLKMRLPFVLKRDAYHSTSPLFCSSTPPTSPAQLPSADQNSLTLASFTIPLTRLPSKLIPPVTL